jgi:hypothetical protein
LHALIAYYCKQALGETADSTEQIKEKANGTETANEATAEEDKDLVVEK